MLVRVPLWRMMVAVSLVASVLRSSPFSGLLGQGMWYAVQFAPIAVATVATLWHPRRELRRSDRVVLNGLSLMVVVAILSSLTSTNPAATLAQSALLAASTLFLVTAYTRRWVSPQVIRGDLLTVFVTLVGIQTSGLVGAMFSGWAFDIDYGRYVGMYSNANYAGMASAMGIMLGFYLLTDGRFKLLMLAGMGVLTLTMVMSGSRGVLLGAAAGIVVLLVARRARGTVVCVVVVVSLLATALVLSQPRLFAAAGRFFVREAQTDITSGRLAIYDDLLDQFWTTPLFGTGYRTSELAIGFAGHNIYVSVLAETGLVGFTAFALLITAIIVASRQGNIHRPLVAAATTVAVIELTESSIYGFGGPTALIAWVIVLAFAASGKYLTDALGATPSPLTPDRRTTHRVPAPKTRVGTTGATRFPTPGQVPPVVQPLAPH